jgi:hypothetical protein
MSADLDLPSLVEDIGSGAWGIPEWQRTFEAKPAFVADLADSLCRKMLIGGLTVWRPDDGTTVRSRYQLVGSQVRPAVQPGEARSPSEPWRWGADWGATDRSGPLQTAQDRSRSSEETRNLRFHRATRPGTGLTRGFEPRHSPHAGRPWSVR